MIRSPRGDEGGPDLRGFGGAEWEEAIPEGERRDHHLGSPAQASALLSSTGKVTAQPMIRVGRRASQIGLSEPPRGQGLGSHRLYTGSGSGQVATGVDGSRGAGTTDTFPHM